MSGLAGTALGGVAMHPPPEGEVQVYTAMSESSNPRPSRPSRSLGNVRVPPPRPGRSKGSRPRSMSPRSRQKEHVRSAAAVESSIARRAAREAETQRIAEQNRALKEKISGAGPRAVTQLSAEVEEARGILVRRCPPRGCPARPLCH
mmetsp:Transcript_12464/g.39440  ORF Transcript_12464/g.39440 Transcript_12464/m.39440 type:complete len:147 (-) Transcript_12464:54-494(-)